VDRIERGNTFDFYNDSPFNEQIDAIAAVKGVASIKHWQCLLTFQIQATLEQLKAEACFVCRLEEARTKLSMDRQRGANDLMG
jgi:hypothetical protein